MKQNERLLVYAVTGFLALILVIAVAFGGDPAGEDPRSAGGGTSLGQILNPDADKVAGADAPKTGQEGEDAPIDPAVTPAEQPLVAKPPSADVLVQQRLGAYRRDFTVRIVQARSGDNFTKLVLRWCGQVEPFLSEAIQLNEDTRMMRAGQEVCVPWVDDEVLLARLEAQDGPTVVGGSGVGDAPGLAGTDPATRVGDAGVGFRTPEVGRRETGGRIDLPTGEPVLAAAGFEVYTVKNGDNLWTICAKRYGRGNADRMVREVEALNGISASGLRPDQKLKLPKAAE